MKMTNWYYLLLLVLGFGACTGAREPVERPSHYFDKTEVDLEYGQPESASRYRRPHGVRTYGYDETEADLTMPRVSQPGEARFPPRSSPATPLPQAPLPGGDR